MLENEPNISRTRGPANDFEMTLGRTQPGSLLLRALDMVANAITASRVAELENEHTRNYLRELRDEVADQGGKLLILLVPHARDIDSPSELFVRSARSLANALPPSTPRAVFPLATML